MVQLSQQTNVRGISRSGVRYCEKTRGDITTNLEVLAVRVVTPTWPECPRPDVQGYFTNVSVTIRDLFLYWMRTKHVNSYTITLTSSFRCIYIRLQSNRIYFILYDFYAIIIFELHFLYVTCEKLKWKPPRNVDHVPSDIVFPLLVRNSSRI